jgi:hypothetical protein
MTLAWLAIANMPLNLELTKNANILDNVIVMITFYHSGDILPI